VSLFDAIYDPNETVDAGRRVHGVALGIVSNNRDPEALARVKVQMPWLARDAESDWVQIATLHAGDGRGSVWLPEVGDSVLLAFEHGDINYPYVIGALWHRNAKPPETNAEGRNDIKTIRSRSGHVITFCDDGQNKRERLEIRSKGGHRIELSDAAGSETVTVSDRSGKNTLTLNSLADCATLKAGARIAIEATDVAILGNVRITGNAEITGAAEIIGPVNVTGAVSVEGTTDVVGALTVEGVAEVTGVIMGILVPPV
jgi:uncharacterized protein involved in type VI secretion and phage assembly